MSCLGSLQHLWGELLLGAMAVQMVAEVYQLEQMLLVAVMVI